MALGETNRGPMIDYHRIYQEQADEYERLVLHEDYEGNILAALRQIRPLEGLDVVELGAGTGRMTGLLAPIVRSIMAFDISAHMLGIAAAKLKENQWHHCSVGVADHRRLPVPSQAADLAISGWSVVFTVVDYPETWQQELGQALNDIRRVLRPGGTIVILETMGTGFESPNPPEHLVPYYRFLEQEQGFSSTWIRTDLLFESVEQARERVTFFFGEDMIHKVIPSPDENHVLLPECTGIWWTAVP
jgi:ubiquinone/menaquinone biosynthesis C-methylase UbiE